MLMSILPTVPRSRASIADHCSSTPFCEVDCVACTLIASFSGATGGAVELGAWCLLSSSSLKKSASVLKSRANIAGREHTSALAVHGDGLGLEVGLVSVSKCSATAVSVTQLSGVAALFGEIDLQSLSLG